MLFQNLPPSEGQHCSGHPQAMGFITVIISDAMIPHIGLSSVYLSVCSVLTIVSVVSRLPRFRDPSRSVLSRSSADLTSAENIRLDGGGDGTVPPESAE